MPTFTSLSYFANTIKAVEEFADLLPVTNEWNVNIFFVGLRAVSYQKRVQLLISARKPYNKLFRVFSDLALNQPTGQISTDFGGVASRAVDGGTSTDYADGSCTHTTATTDPWWRVDLGSSVAVAEVRIVNRACYGDCGSRLSSFEIRIGK